MSPGKDQESVGQALNVNARASWTAAVLCRFSNVATASESARGLAHSKTWRQFVAAFCLFVTLFAQLSPLHAQPAANNQPRTTNNEPTPNYVLHLDGKDGSYAELPASAFTNESVVTIEGWMKWDQEDTGGFKRFFDFTVGGVNYAVANAYDVNTGSPSRKTNVRLSRWTLTEADYRWCNNILEPGKWVHIAAVCGTNTLKLYVNGFLMPLTVTGTALVSNSEKRNLLGRSGPSFGIFYSTGQMDEVRVWKGERPAQEIQANLHRRLTGAEDGLITLLNFDDPANPGRNAANAAASAVLNGTKAVLAELPKPNRVLELDGKDGSYVELPASAFTNHAVVTVEGWVKWESFRLMSRVFDFALKDRLVSLKNQSTDPHLWSELYQSGIRLSHRVPDVLRTGEWGHLALTVAPDGSKLYFNGRSFKTPTLRRGQGLSERLETRKTPLGRLSPRFSREPSALRRSRRVFDAGSWPPPAGGAPVNLQQSRANNALAVSATSPNIK